jgi:4-carboxymuconolactone decarboxylase
VGKESAATQARAACSRCGAFAMVKGHAAEGDIVLARLSMLPREQLPEKQQRFYDAVIEIRRGTLTGPFITAMHSNPDLAARNAHLGNYFHDRNQADISILSSRVRTFTAIIGARALDGVYEWAAWSERARQAGVPEEAIAAVRERRKPANLSEEDARVYDVVTQLLGEGHRLQEETYAAALAHFGPQGIVELVATLAYFSMIAFPLNAFEIEARPGGAVLPIDSQPAPHPKRNEPLGKGGNVSTRLAIARREDMPADRQHFYDRIVRSRGTVSGPFSVLLNSPDVAARVAHVGEAILFNTVLSPAVSTLTILLAAHAFDCDYVWAVCLPHARRAGVPQALIDAIQGGRSPAGLTREEGLVVDFCHQLLRGNHHVSNDTYRAVVEHFGIPASVQIAWTVGYTVMLGFIVNAFEVKHDPTDPRLAL